MVRRNLKKIVATVIVSVIVTCSTTKVDATYRFFIITEKQQKDRWCWVTVARGLARNDALVELTQSDGVAYVKGSVVNESGSIEDVQAAAHYFTDFKYSYYESGGILSLDTIVELIDRERVIAAACYKPSIWGGNTGHMFLIVGYNTNEDFSEVVYSDPYDGEIYNKDYDEFCVGEYIYENSIYRRYK
ncbi:MAG: hypothetical protein IJA34_16330 [Lachnospiraceae bacterium]|nr:hypothetical protein [Lachnospiraceae bacterium]